MSSVTGILGMFIGFLGLVANAALAVAAFGLIKIAARPGLEKLKIGGYALGAIALTSVLGSFMNAVVTHFLMDMIGYDGVQIWFGARGIIGSGIDILGCAALAYACMAAAKD